MRKVLRGREDGVGSCHSARLHDGTGVRGAIPQRIPAAARGLARPRRAQQLLQHAKGLAWTVALVGCIAHRLCCPLVLGRRLPWLRMRSWLQCLLASIDRRQGCQGTHVPQDTHVLLLHISFRTSGLESLEQSGIFKKAKPMPQPVAGVATCCGRCLLCRLHLVLYLVLARELALWKDPRLTRIRD
jgi:hypothetical protein